MLKRIKSIQGVGLFCDAQGAAEKDLAEVTLIFGENARGKSTLASVFGAAATSDSAPILARETIDQQLKPEVQFEYSNGKTVRFKDGKWKGDASSLRVFDSEFVDRNVHSGSVVAVAHRQNLLTLAVGEESVKAKRAQEALAAKRAEVTTKQAVNESKLQALSGKMGVPEFVGLPRVEDLDSKIQAKSEQLTSVLSERSIANQEKPRPHDVPSLDIESLTNDLRLTLNSLQNAAEAAVREHVQSLRGTGARAWIGEGLQYTNDETCPFCGQNTDESDLIKHYRSVFDEKYRALKATLEESLTEIETAVPTDISSTFQQSLTRVNDAINPWIADGHIVVALGSSDGSVLKETARNFRDTAVGLVVRKTLDLNYVPSSVDEQTLRASYTALVEVFRRENEIVQAALDAITQYLAGLGTLDADTVRDELLRLEKAKVRHSEDAIALAEERTSLQTEIKKIDADAKSARAVERAKMAELLGTYAERINQHLSAQNARFTISEPTLAYNTTPPGTAYTIQMRGQVVNLKGEANTFKTALSESDKRSLAFAFFLAATLDDPNLSDQIVVVDDPMTSLDRNRRAKTVKYLADIAIKCDQLIVLAHDPRFLLDLDSELQRMKKYHASDGGNHKIVRNHLKLATVKIDADLDPYTDFAECDLAVECESKYARNYRIVSDFVAEPRNDHIVAGTAIRPLLEGYLHRRFPRLLRQNSMLGDSLKAIEAASGNSPLVIAQPQVSEMFDIGYFGNNPHHDADIDFQPPLPSHDETYGYAEKCLRIVHGE